MRLCAISLFLAALALAGVTASSAHAAGHSSRRRASVQAFLLASSPDSLADLESHAASVSVVYPTYFNCQTPGGLLSGHDVPAITTYARAHQIAVMPRFNCQDGPTVHRILTEARTRTATLARLGAIARDAAFSGLCLDLENDGAGDRAALSAFVSALARELHAHGKKLTVVVDGVTREGPTISTGFYDDRALSTEADTIFVLAWGVHWADSEPGPIAPLSYVAAVAHYVASLAHASRFVLGAPMYGLDWSTGSEAAQPATAYEYSGIRALAGSVGAAPMRDPASGELTFSYTTAAGVTHRVWYMDARAVLGVLRIARSEKLAVGLWRLGSEDQALWSSLPLTG